MRQLFKRQLTLSSPSVQDLIGARHTRDDTDKLVLGLNEILQTPRLRTKILTLLEDTLQLPVALGREGMDYWKLFVFGTTRVDLDLDYDRLQNMANNHRGLRKILGHGDLDGHEQYGITTLKDNVTLLTPELLEAISTVIVQHGHDVIHPYAKDPVLSCRGDSFVSMTDVHFPTDISLLNDAVRKVIEITGHLGKVNSIPGFRQYKHNRSTLKSLMHRARNSKKRKNTEAIKASHQAYNDFAQQLLDKADTQLVALAEQGVLPLQQKELAYYQSCARKFIDQIERRVMKEEQIPHEEKIFSIFEPHTEWVCKGKSGVPVELGLKVTIIQDQHQFILHHQVMEKEQDPQVAVQVIKAVREKYGEIDSISFDRGYWSAENEAELKQFVRTVILPKKGYRNEARKEIEDEKEFKTLRHKHSAVESGINDLQVHGLQKVPDHGLEGYKRYIALGIVGFNIHRLGSILLEKHYQAERKRAA